EYDTPFPGWLGKKVRAYASKYGTPNYGDNYVNFPYVAKHIGEQAGIDYPSWFWDHYGVIRVDGKCLLIVEPYDFDLNMAALCDAICKALDVRCNISPNSYHYPGSTMRIVFHPQATVNQ